MSSKWKYANLDAETRLEMLRSGNKEVFDEEVERTKSVTNARKELGLDTTAQENWMDTVGYNYNLSAAKAQGEPADNVSKTGYAKLYLRDPNSKNNGEMSKVKAYKTTSGLGDAPISAATYKIKSAGEKAQAVIKEKYAALKEAAKNEMYDKYPYLNEAIVNSGASLEGGKAAKIRADVQAELDKIYGDYDKAMELELQASNKKYAGLVEQLLDYRRNGYAKSSLGTLADMLVYKASREDGYDAPTPTQAKRIEAAYKKQAEREEKAALQAENAKNAKNTDNTEAVGDSFVNANGGEPSSIASYFGESGITTEDAMKQFITLTAGLSQPQILRVLTSLGVGATLAAELAERLAGVHANA